ncbi:competence type IV pilus minor pilin ComGG [Bacillus sp. FJAT-44742]|uniref:competence type IV pilus minor pilin ComGG n=1 Tax=Bacillus sp. FJAT-44742 TaxID=2014005 RepID=UPI000C23B589|nr:competence type IV pilus minor pilin ComGG [Bacillus sp. FJAT-44742]
MDQQGAVMPAVLFFSLLLGGMIVHHLLLFGNEKMMMKETGSSFLLDRMIIEGERDWWEEWDPKQKVVQKTISYPAGSITYESTELTSTLVHVRWVAKIDSGQERQHYVFYHLPGTEP